MLRYIAKRLVMMIPILFGITIVSFLVIHLAPGEPTDIAVDMNPNAAPEAKERLREIYGLNEPLHVQYLNWVKRIVVLDFGNSFAPDNRPVIEKIAETIPITITINVLSILLIMVMAIPIGIYSATHQNSVFDKTSTVFVFIGFAVPTFWLALLLKLLFGIKLGWLPISGVRSISIIYETFGPVEKAWDLFSHLLMPVTLSAFGGLAGLSRYMRSNMLEVIRQDYITTARAKGLPERTVIYKHAMRNALMPVITILGLSVPGLIGGSVIFESIFSIYGMGRLFYASVLSRDYPVVMGILVIGAVLTLAGNLIADVSYALVDPRIRKG